MADCIGHGLAVARPAKGKVDHIGAIVRGPANSLNCIGEVSRSVLIEDADGHDFCVVRDARDAAAVLGRSNCAGHMGSMTVGVLGDGIAINEVVASPNAPLEFAVVVVDAGIDHGDGHAFARRAGAVVVGRPDFWRADHVEVPEIASEGGLIVKRAIQQALKRTFGTHLAVAVQAAESSLRLSLWPWFSSP